MKKFMEPAIELKIFAVEDVITASSGNGGYIPGPNDTPMG